MQEYIGAAEFARLIGTSRQNVSLAGKRALNPNYRGTFPRPDAVQDGHPLWHRDKAEAYARERQREKEEEKRPVDLRCLCGHDIGTVIAPVSIKCPVCGTTTTLSGWLNAAPEKKKYQITITLNGKVIDEIDF
jgi:hypothetical protein